AQAGTTPPADPALGAPPRNLGTIPESALGQQQAARPPAASTPEQQYEQAISLMLRDQDFPAAEAALRGFIEAHPGHELTGNAQYWLGETYYVRGDYERAAFAFAEGFQKYPSGQKAADNLLKLGMSLGQLGKTAEACTAFDQLLQSFPNANGSVKS